MKIRSYLQYKYSVVIFLVFVFSFSYSSNVYASHVSIGDRVQANADLNVRSTAGGSLVDTEPSGGKGTVKNGPQGASLNGTFYTWYQVQWDSGLFGWSVDQGLNKITTIVPSTPSNPSPGSTSSPGSVMSSTSVTLSWSLSSGATYYDLGVRDMTTNALVVDTTVSGTSFTANLTKDGKYRWNVAACNSSGCSSFTTPLYFQTPSPPELPSSFNLTATPECSGSTSQIRLNWTTSSNATSYDVYRNGSYYDSVPSGTKYINSGNITPGSNYSYFIRAQNSNGSTDSNTKSVTAEICDPILSFTSLSPTPITTSTAPHQQDLSASGSNFNNVNTITWSWSGAGNGSKNWNKGDTDWSSKVTVNSDTSMTLRPEVLATGDPEGTYNWTVTLKDTSGATASRTFTVDYTQSSVINISVSTTSVNFGNVTVGQSSDQNITITNQSSSTGNLTGSVGSVSGQFSVVSGGSSFNLTPGQSRTVTIRFSPSSLGQFSGSFSINHNAGNQGSPVTVSLSGTGVDVSCNFSISGKVVNSTGSGLIAIDVTLGGKTTMSTKTTGGSYTFSGLCDGSYTVTPVVSGFTFTPLSRSVTISGSNVNNVDFTGTKINDCLYSISPSSLTASYGAEGGSGSISVTVNAGNNCSWTASSSQSWITITSGKNGTGNGTVNYSVSANTGTNERNGSIAVAGKTFNISQKGKNGTSVVWVTPPADNLTSGQAFNLSWKITGGSKVEHTNIHWDTIDPTDFNRCNANNNPPCSNDLQTGNAGTYSDTKLCVPEVSGTTVYKYAAHAKVDGKDYWSDIVSSTVSQRPIQTIQLRAPWDDDQYWGPETYDTHMGTSSTQRKDWNKAVDFYYVDPQKPDIYDPEIKAKVRNREGAGKGSGKRVIATHSGTVKIASSPVQGCKDQLLIVDENGNFRTKYIHIDFDPLIDGKFIQEGQKIGTIAATDPPCGTAPHLMMIVEEKRCDGWKRLPLDDNDGIFVLVNNEVILPTSKKEKRTFTPEHENIWYYSSMPRTGQSLFADFTFTTSKLEANFTDKTTGGTKPYKYSWDFGDGSGKSPNQSPSHTYTREDTYDVILEVTDDSVPSQSSEKTKPVTVSITPVLPTVITFSINNDAKTTSDRTVILNNSCTGNPTHYMASENPAFNDAAWQTYSTVPKFTLSSGNGERKVFFKVKNGNGESNEKTDTIEEFTPTTTPTPSPTPKPTPIPTPEPSVLSKLMVNPTSAERFSRETAIVTALDQKNEPMSGVRVDVSTSNGAVIFPKSKTTATNGKAEFLFMFLFKNGGKITFTAGGFTETITQE